MNSFFILPRPVIINLRDSLFVRLLLRCFRFPELCQVTVRLPEIFASRRQAALLIPSALLFADLLCPSSTIICSLRSGLVRNPCVIIKLHLLPKIKPKHFLIVFINDIDSYFSAFFRNFFVELYLGFPSSFGFFNTFRYIFTHSRHIYAKSL